MSDRLSPGDAAPAFTLNDADGQQVSLSDYAGGKVIVYFYPAAMTPGCTTQAVDFTAAVDDLDSAGLAVVGISPDSPDKLAQFKASSSVAFPLLADPERTALTAYGAYGSKMLYGKLVEGAPNAYEYSLANLERGAHSASARRSPRASPRMRR